MAKIFDGRALAQKKKERVRQQVATLREKGARPTLASLFLPEDAGSSQYTRIKSEAAKSVGIEFISFEIKDKKDISAITSQIRKLNQDPNVHGILLQRPAGYLGWSSQEWSQLVSAIDPKKDVDGLTPESLGLIEVGTPRFIPATVKAVLDILDAENFLIEGQNIAMLGASEIFGKPASMLLVERDATVTLLHKKSQNIESYTQQTDIIISATGQKGLIAAEMVKDGAIVIDVGSPEGDVQTEVAEKASFITPVPGGVGPVTVACLLENTVQAVLN